MKIIDADELRKTMYHEAFETDTDMQKWDSGCWIRYKMFENAIENAPTIETEPIRHGYWINDDLCSCCGNITEVYEEYTARDFDYCPWCGAKMDEVNDDTK